MARYHLNPEKGPMRCSAKTNCPYGADAPHFDDKAKAQEAYEAGLSATNPFPSHTRPVVEPASLGVTFAAAETMSYEDAELLASRSPQDHGMLKTIVDARAVRSAETARILSSLNPSLNDNGCDRETFESLQANLGDYRRQTTLLLEAYGESPYYRPQHRVALKETVGETTRLEAQSPSGVTSKSIGELVKNEFAPEDQMELWDRDALNGVMSSSINPSQNISAMVAERYSQYSSALWARRNLDAFASANPDLQVVAVSGLYRNNEKAWQQVSVDGLLQRDGEENPSGMLAMHDEEDPVRWSKGVPMQERAQALYALNATKLDYAVVTVNFTDGMQRSYRIERDDPVAPGAYDGSMDSYLKERVEPKLSSLIAS